jgi:hypothetical protein
VGHLAKKEDGMKNLIIGGMSNCKADYAHNWLESILRFKDDTFDVALVYGDADTESVRYLSSKGVKLHCYAVDRRLAPHVQRFIYIWDFLYRTSHRSINQGLPYDKVITTDVRDVVFQSNPFDFIQNDHSRLFFSSEQLLYKDEPWGRQNLQETFGLTLYENWKHWEIFNVGVLAGKSANIEDLMLQIFITCQGRPIPICDQAVFNYLINRTNFATTMPEGIVKFDHSSPWCVQAGTVADPNKLDMFRPHWTRDINDLRFEIRNGLIGRVLPDDSHMPYIIVHQYDRVPEWKKLIEEKYK